MKVPEEIIGHYWYNGAIYKDHNIMLRISSNGAMDCCGTSTLTGVGKHFYTEKDKQNFVYFLMNYINLKYSHLFIANDNQMLQSGLGNICGLLRELGAKEVDDTKNRNWGTSRMHLHVWNPTLLCGGAIRKYLHVEDNGYMTPLWYHQLDDEGKEKALEESLPYWKASQECLAYRKEAQKNHQRLNDMNALYRLNLNSKSELEARLKQMGWVKANGQENVSTSTTVGLFTNPVWSA